MNAPDELIVHRRMFRVVDAGNNAIKVEAVCQRCPQLLKYGCQVPRLYRPSPEVGQHRMLLYRLLKLLIEPGIPHCAANLDCHPLCKVDVPERVGVGHHASRSEEHTSELQSLMRISYAVFCLKKKKTNQNR